VAGQVAFVLTVLPMLRLAGRRRSRDIEAHAGLDTSSIDGAILVRSVNDPATLAALLDLSPALVVVHGTRIIAGRILRAVDAPMLNLHMGITPRYRGVHGGYWALADGRPDLAGTTVHLVDEGIDTGGILGQATFEASARDSIATYPALHVACGLPVLIDVAGRLLDGVATAPVAPLAGAEGSQLRWHPTAWGYLARRFRHGVR
jgi:methionyl-tRNA formyltransferase